MPWTNVCVVALGGVVGCLARWGAGVWLNARWSGFPLGTLFVNCVGGLFIGMALYWFERSPNETLRLLVITGVLGGFTTFSSFSAESLDPAAAGRTRVRGRPRHRPCAGRPGRGRARIQDRADGSRRLAIRGRIRGAIGALPT